MDNLEMFCRVYHEYPALISEAMSRELDESVISDAPRRKSPSGKSLSGLPIGYTLRDQSWQPGKFHPNPPWTHYRTLLRANEEEARAFHEIEAIRNNWSARDPSFRPGMEAFRGRLDDIRRGRLTDMRASFRCHSGKSRNPVAFLSRGLADSTPVFTPGLKPSGAGLVTVE